MTKYTIWNFTIYVFVSCYWNVKWKGAIRQEARIVWEEIYTKFYKKYVKGRYWSDGCCLKISVLVSIVTEIIKKRHFWWCGAVAYRGGGGLGVQTPPPKFRRPSKIVPNSTRLWKLIKTAEFRTPTPQDARKKGSKILKLPSVRNCFTLAMTDKLVVIINSLKVPTIKKILLYEMKFLVSHYSCLQNPWLGGYRSQNLVLSVLCPQLNLLKPPPPGTEFLGTPLHTAIQYDLYSLELVTFQFFLIKTVKSSVQIDKWRRDIPTLKCYFLHRHYVSTNYNIIVQFSAQVSGFTFRCVGSTKSCAPTPMKATWLSFLEYVREKPFPNLRYLTVPFAIHSHAARTELSFTSHLPLKRQITM